TWSGLGNATSSATTPTAVTLSATISIQCVTEVAPGDGHFLALPNAAGFFAWGSNSARQLSADSTTSRATPQNVIFPPWATSVTKIAAAALHSLAVTNEVLAKVEIGRILQPEEESMAVERGIVLFASAC